MRERAQTPPLLIILRRSQSWRQGWISFGWVEGGQTWADLATLTLGLCPVVLINHSLCCTSLHYPQYCNQSHQKHILTSTVLVGNEKGHISVHQKRKDESIVPTKATAGRGDGGPGSHLAEGSFAWQVGGFMRVIAVTRWHEGESGVGKLVCSWAHRGGTMECFRIARGYYGGGANFWQLGERRLDIKSKCEKKGKCGPIHMAMDQWLLGHVGNTRIGILR